MFSGFGAKPTGTKFGPIPFSTKFDAKLSVTKFRSIYTVCTVLDSAKYKGKVKLERTPRIIRIILTRALIMRSAGAGGATVLAIAA